jgi:putative hemolysin
VIWLDPEDDQESIRTEMIDSGHSRFPVARGSLDEFDGIVQAKDLLDQLMRTGAIDMSASLRQPLVVHDKTPVLKVLDMFRGSSVHMAIVVDEYGSVEGVVTPTDILTAIAGDLPEGSEAEEEDAVRRDDGSWLMDGMMSIDDAERTLGRSDMRAGGDYNTLAGFLLAEMEHLPVAGENFEWGGWRFEVVDMDGRRIDKVLVTPVRMEAEADATEI